MAGTTSPIISNLLSSLERLSQFMPTFSSLAASSSSSIAQEDVTTAKVNSNQERLMEDLSRLGRMLRRIQAVLHDAEEREINEKAIQLWLSELREVAYDAEDVLDQYDYQVIKTQLEGMTTKTEAEPSLKQKRVDDDDFYGYQVPLPPSNSIKIPISYDMAIRITEIIKKFDEIANDRKALMLKEEDAPRRPYFNDVMKRPPSSSHQDESNIFGREDDKKKIIELLMSHSEKENIVIPIVGLGGVGKTTFARLIYNDPVVCQHFFPKDWKINWALHALQDSEDDFWKEAWMDGRFIREIKQGFLDDEFVGMDLYNNNCLAVWKDVIWAMHELHYQNIERRNI